ncbi:MAG: 3-methyl-2-oxobutanoate dehydrogenase subunit VorB [Oscillospiraceae bacterium]|nr:3-methyl-2-oxobutanoate dehydrogenase subunit VorB [Oscillospiraceae bacterium]
MSKVLMKGNEAMAEAAIRAGCRFFFGYPITPQNEVPEYMSARMPQVGGCFIQSESEIAAINMVYGAAGAGVRAMTSSSSPGISLKQEGISYLAAAELPCVIANMMRGGPGLGGIQATQGDYAQAVKGGGHGDYRMIVFAPASVQEVVDLTSIAFELADKYRMPAMILADGIIGQMMEPVEFPEMKEYIFDVEKKPWAAVGWKPGDKKERAVINSLYIEVDEMHELNLRLQARYKEIKENEVRCELFMTDDAQIIICAYGTVARICKAAVEDLREEGVKVGLLRPVTVFPFPEKQIKKLAAGPDLKAFVSVELSAGQMCEDVRLAVNGKKEVDFLGNAGSKLPSQDEIKDLIRRKAEGKT